MKLPNENPSIGIILCKEKSNTVVEYAFRSVGNAMGAATFKTAKELPEEMKAFLPDVKKLSGLL